MFERFGELGDRLLSLVVPKAKASAVICWYEYASISSPCIRRYCCTGSGVPDGYCTPYRPC
ncbi:hypothetical protein [Thermobifida cellulosilytica]|uniref:Uncharacterized protein n=1 Tax=Thermobifida cellulosilytica TB100 TaxID=665004 RepID=A0A147KMW2_THECS|nr:hypothetical protein [Thermobifida cellulosilytica]KUP98675.1 hypothetical protein AC529_00060 [Thermobifida cellulosilytica TB100]